MDRTRYPSTFTVAPTSEQDPSPVDDPTWPCLLTPPPPSSVTFSFSLAQATLVSPGLADLRMSAYAVPSAWMLFPLIFTGLPLCPEACTQTAPDPPGPLATCSRPPSSPPRLWLSQLLLQISLVICLLSLHLLEGKLPKDKHVIGFMLEESRAQVMLSKQVSPQKDQAKVEQAVLIQQRVTFQACHHQP